MKPLTTFARFWYDFIVGDDWKIAAGTVAAIAVAAIAAGDGLNIWWVLLLTVSALLAVSVSHAARMKPVSQDPGHLSGDRTG
jgi:hypothetical protein